ncbi:MULTISPECIES: hypothetical protein [Haloarcula]|uniref:ABC-2 type transport system permease protein n=1 Tax=Haloarcula pellucida TaxID=1427151 RepID=A0A830GMY0_9EURY|nr:MULTISPECIES: hypothetical protein [Halomicroarcula]MBX0349754.1 hypothetical protein [Halomicroarcula pellucida]MDS0279492.1 hypothetical protein [Halomicroarcula sp. S1AR25-4]GGN94149.1 hypothetical protein GCM10009030_20240 [Halomicroarcula pellucida]
MSDTTEIIDLSEALVWQQLNSRRLKLFAMPLFLAVVFGGITVVSISSPGAVTPTTRQSVQRLVELYFGELNSEYAFALALFLIQGPYLLATFSSVLGVNTGQRMAGKLISSGQFELLLSSPYHERQVFNSLLLSTTLVTLLQVFAFALVALGIPIAVLVSIGAELGAQLNATLLPAFLLPLPTAIWANLVVILGSMGIGGNLSDGVQELFSVVGIVPGLGLTVLVNLFPNLNLVLFSVASLVLILCLIAICGYWVTTRFHAEDILPAT